MALLAVLGLAAAFAQWRPREPAPPAAKASPAPSIPRAACHARTFEGAAFTICNFDRRIDTIEIASNGPSGQPLRSFAALQTSLGARATKVRFAVNAGMFDDGGDPIGLFVDNGTERRRLNRRKGGGNFHLLPNGVFAQDKAGRVYVASSEVFEARVRRPRWATQSGPMLVIDGKLHPRFEADGPSRLIRNGVGVSDANTAWFAVSEEGVSFGRFARLFRDALGCRNALFLDGSVSSLWHPAEGRQDAIAPLGPMIVVSRP